MFKKDELAFVLLVGQMVLSGIGLATIEFFISVRDLLAQEDGASIAEMGRKSFLMRQSASRHVEKLEEKGYITRLHYRAWRMSPTILALPEATRALMQIAA